MSVNPLIGVSNSASPSFAACSECSSKVAYRHRQPWCYYSCPAFLNIPGVSDITHNSELPPLCLKTARATSPALCQVPHWINVLCSDIQLFRVFTFKTSEHKSRFPPLLTPAFSSFKMFNRWFSHILIRKIGSCLIQSQIIGPLDLYFLHQSIAALQSCKKESFQALHGDAWDRIWNLLHAEQLLQLSLTFPAFPWLLLYTENWLWIDILAEGKKKCCPNITI